jgi:hypothetical protein
MALAQIKVRRLHPPLHAFTQVAFLTRGWTAARMLNDQQLEGGGSWRILLCDLRAPLFYACRKGTLCALHRACLPPRCGLGAEVDVAGGILLNDSGSSDREKYKYLILNDIFLKSELWHDC